jgi:transcriptional regulator with XRE-family HTH domain
MTLAKNMKRLRTANRQSQMDVAKKTKVTQSLIAQLETGAVLNPKLVTLRRLAKALNTTIAGLLE